MCENLDNSDETEENEISTKLIKKDIGSEFWKQKKFHEDCYYIYFPCSVSLSLLRTSFRGGVAYVTCLLERLKENFRSLYSS